MKKIIFTSKKIKFTRVLFQALIVAASILVSPDISVAQAPTLGTAANFVLFSTNGAVTNSGSSVYTGDVGTNLGPISGFGNVNGVMHDQDGASAAGAADLLIAYNQLNGATATLFPSSSLGGGDTLQAGVYKIFSTATLDGNLFLDAQGDPNAVFIFQLQAAFSTFTSSKIILINGAQACNVFWKVEGMVSMASGTYMRGTVVANNASINTNTSDSLEGRLLSTTGAISAVGTMAFIPTGCNAPVLTGPIAPVLGSAACFGVFSANGGVTNSGITYVTGDVGTNAGLAQGFDPLLVKGTIHPMPDVSTATCAADLQSVYNYINLLTPDIELLYPTQFGNNLVLTPHTYLLNAATVLTGSVFLNAQGDSNAVFIIKINGAFSTSTFANVVLQNGTQPKNIFWQVEGALNINDNSVFNGTIICNNGAIALNVGDSINGHVFTTNGALTVASAVITMPSGPCSLNYWTGAVSTDWSNASNWTVGVPTSTIGAIIPATVNQPVISNNTITAADSLVIYNGAILTNNGTLDVYGNFKDSGSFVSGSGSNVVLIGVGTISGTDTFSNLEIQGDFSVGSAENDRIAVTGILKKTSGILYSSDKLILISNANGSAMIEENGGILNGKAYIQHYTSGAFGYHHFSSPIVEGNVSSWSNSFPISGPDQQGAWTSNWGTLQYYDEVDNNTSVLDSSYYNYTALSDSLTPGKGYTAWLNSLQTLITFGTPNNGLISLPVTNTSTADSNTRGWNFVGNPYPSPISWTALYNLNTGLLGDASCYLWKSAGGLNGTWEVYNGTAGTNGAGDVINSSLGFFVYVNNSGTLNFDNSVRTYSYLSPEIFGSSATAINSLRVSISEPLSKTKDEVIAYTGSNESYSKKMPQPIGATNPTITFEVKGTKAAINVLNTIDSKTELPLVIITPKAGTYTLTVNTNNISLPVYLKDNVTGTYTDLLSNASITTTTKETVGRYSIVFATPELTVSSNQLAVYPNPGKDNVIISGNHIAQIQVVDNLGRLVKVISLQNAINPTLSVSSLPAGVYHLRIQTTDGKVNGVGFVKE